MKTLYLHIGTSRTGTTAIQRFCTDNLKFLKENNCCYPVAKYRYKYISPRRNGSFLVYNAIVPEGQDVGLYNEKMLDDCFSTLVKSFENCDKVLLSNENLWGRLGLRYTERWDRLKKLSEDENFNIKLIVYLRRQDEWIESSWNQRIKHENYDKTIEEYVEEIIWPLDYYKRLEELSKLVGKENIIVRRYEKGQLLDGSSVSDLLNILGIEYDDKQRSINYADPINIRLTNNMLYLKRMINHYSASNKIKDSFVEKGLLAASQESNAPKTAMFPIEKAKAFYEKYSESNKKVAEEYIGDTKSLFTIDINDSLDDWSEDNEHIVDDIIKSMGAILGKMLETIEEQNNRIERLERKLNKRL